MMTAKFKKFSLSMTEAQARSAATGYPLSVKVTMNAKRVNSQLRALHPDDVKEVLKDFGAWKPEELVFSEKNLQRLVWIAAVDIKQQLYTKGLSNAKKTTKSKASRSA